MTTANAPVRDGLSGLSEHGTTRSVLTALAVLECFADDEELGVTQIARSVGVAKSTAHRLLASLCTRGIAEQDSETGRYRLGLHLYELGHLAQHRILLRRVALPFLEDLRLKTQQTIHLSVADGPDVIVVERFYSMPGIALVAERPRRAPLHVTGSGKALAAFDPAANQARLAAGLSAKTARTITDQAAWARALDEVRHDGYAVSDGEECDGIASVAAPIRDTTGQARAAVSIIGPAATINPTVDRYARLVIVTAARLSRRLAW